MSLDQQPKLALDEARSLLEGWTPGPALRRHARAVELVMRAACARYGPQGADADADAERWAITGLLHDADYETWPETHPQRIVAWLVARGEPAIAYAISAHYTQWGVPHQTPLDRALLACDELTGFIMAYSLVRPEGIRTLEVKSVRKKLEDKRFAAGVDRREVQAGLDALGVSLAEHVQFIIDTLRPHAAELGLGGHP